MPSHDKLPGDGNYNLHNSPHLNVLKEEKSMVNEYESKNRFATSEEESITATWLQQMMETSL